MILNALMCNEEGMVFYFSGGVLSIILQLANCPCYRARMLEQPRSLYDCVIMVRAVKGVLHLNEHGDSKMPCHRE